MPHHTSIIHQAHLWRYQRHRIVHEGLAQSLEPNYDLRPVDSYALRNELTAVLEKIETRQYSNDKPLDVAEEIAEDWKRVANDDQQIARWLNGPGKLTRKQTASLPDPSNPM